MSEQTDQNEIETPTPAPHSGSRDDAKEAYKARDEAKKRARDLEARNRELEAREAEREAAAAAAAEEAERKKNDFAAVEERHKKRIADAEKRAAEAESRIAARERSDREAALVDAVMPKLGVNNRLVIEGALLALAKRGLDIAPEELDEKIATDVAKKVRTALGELHPPRSGGSPGTPGMDLDTKPPSERPDTDANKTRLAEMQKRRSRK